MPIHWTAQQLTLRRKPHQERRNVWTLPELLKDEGVTDSPQEIVLVAPYDAQTNLGSLIEVARGDMTSVTISIPITIGAVLASGCNRFWLIHNHPSGHLEPTEIDKQLTEKVQLSAAIAGVALEDHIIVGPPDGWFSFDDHGIFTVSEVVAELVAATKAGEMVLPCADR